MNGFLLSIESSPHCNDGSRKIDYAVRFAFVELGIGVIKFMASSCSDKVCSDKVYSCTGCCVSECRDSSLCSLNA